MRKWITISFVCLAGCLIAEAASAPVGTNSRVAWDAPTTNEDGTPCTDLGGFKLALSAIGDDLRVSGSTIKVVNITQPTVTEYQLQGFLTDQSDGDYRLWVLAYDLSANESEWADPVDIRWDQKRPGKPGRVRIITQ